MYLPSCFNIYGVITSLYTKYFVQDSYLENGNCK